MPDRWQALERDMGLLLMLATWATYNAALTFLVGLVWMLEPAAFRRLLGQATTR